MKYKLSELVKIKYGKDQKKVECLDGKFPIYGSAGIFGRASEFLYNKPTVLIGRKGTIDKPLYVDKPFWTVDTMFYTIINEQLVLPKYLHYKLQTVDFESLNEGTTIPSLRTETLNSIELDIHDIPTQQHIVDLACRCFIRRLLKSQTLFRLAFYSLALVQVILL